MNTTLDKLREIHAAIENVSQLTGPEGVKAIENLLDEAKKLQQQWLGIARARMLSDEKYMNGRSMRQLAQDVGRSANAISLRIQDYGPKEYVSVHQDLTDPGNPAYELMLVSPQDVRGLIAVGRRVAPSRLGLYDNEEGLLYEGSAQELWHLLASQA